MSEVIRDPDLNLVAPVWKCPAVVYGRGNSALDHTPDEHISLEEYGKAVTMLAEALEQAGCVVSRAAVLVKPVRTFKI